MVTRRRVLSGIGKMKRNLLSVESKGQCSRGDQCSFRHDGRERAKPTPKTAPSSEPPTQEVEVRRENVNSTPTNTARAELHSMITFHHANTRGSRTGRLRIAHLCVPKSIVILVSCLIRCRT